MSIAIRSAKVGGGGGLGITTPPPPPKFAVVKLEGLNPPPLISERIKKK